MYAYTGYCGSLSSFIVNGIDKLLLGIVLYLAVWYFMLFAVHDGMGQNANEKWMNALNLHIYVIDVCMRDITKQK